MSDDQKNWLGVDGLVHQLMPTGTACGEGARVLDGQMGEPSSLPVSCFRCLTPVIRYDCSHDSSVVRACPMDDILHPSESLCRCCDDCALDCAGEKYDREQAEFEEGPDA